MPTTSSVRAGRKNPMIQDTHGWLLTLTGSVDQGIDLLRQVADTNTIPVCALPLAEAYLRQGLRRGGGASAEYRVRDVEKKREMDKAAGRSGLERRRSTPLRPRAGDMIRQRKSTANAPAIAP
jgi:hypothetical protein